MNTALFISKKLFVKEKNSFSSIVSKVAVVSVATGVIILMVSYAILNGFNSAIKEKIFGFSGHLEITKFGADNAAEELPISRNTYIYQNASELPEVTNISVYAKKPALLKTDEGIQGVVLKGVDSEFDSKKFERMLVEGRFLEFQDSVKSKEIVVSSSLAKKMRLNVGDKALLYFVQDPPRLRKLEVVGIYKSGLEEFDEQFTFTDLRIIQKLNGWGDSLVGGYEVNVTDFEELDSTAYKVYDKMDYNLSLVKITDVYYQLFDWFELLATNIDILLIIILIVVKINLLSSFTIIILEKTNRIGTLKALGANDWLIQKIFVLKGLKMLIQGLIIGNVIGLLLCWIQSVTRVFPLEEENYYIDYVPIKFDLEQVLMINGWIILIVLAAIIIPTGFISRITLIKSIKFD